MRPTLFLLSFSLLSLALIPALSADSLYSELPFKTTISLSADGSTINAKATYLELSYFSAAKENNLPTGESELYKPGDYSIDYQSAKTKPLADAQLYFTFEGQKISAGGGATAACDPVVTDAQGEASCPFTHYLDSGGVARKLEDHSTCGTLQAEFRGAQSGAANYKLSSQSIIICPKKAASLSTFGSAIYAAFSKPANMATCFPVLLIAGLLLASMYYAGRDPFSLFDITTPRMPKGKPFRVSAGQSLMSVNSAIRMYQKGMRTSKRAVLKAAEKAAARGYLEKDHRGMSARQWKKEVKRKIEALYKQMEDELRNKKNLEDFDKNKYQSELMAIFEQHGPTLGQKAAGGGMDARKAEAIRKLYGHFEAVASHMLSLYFYMHQSMKIMTDARSGGGNPLKRGLISLYDKLQRKDNAFAANVNKAASKIPGGKALLQGAPGLGLLGLPGKLVDVARSKTASRRGARIMYRLLAGQALYQLFFTTKEGGKTKAFETFRRLFKKGDEEDAKLTLLGKFADKYHLWDPDKAFTRHNIARKKVDELFNEAEYTRMHAAEVINSINKLYAQAVLPNNELVEQELKNLRESALRMRNSQDKNIASMGRKLEAQVDVALKRIDEAKNPGYIAKVANNVIAFEMLDKKLNAPAHKEARERLSRAREVLDQYVKDVEKSRGLLAKLNRAEDPGEKLEILLKMCPTDVHHDRAAIIKDYKKAIDDAQRVFALRLHEKHMEAIEWKTVKNFQDALKEIWAERNKIKTIDLDQAFAKDKTLQKKMENFVSSNLHEAMIDGKVTLGGRTVDVVYQKGKLAGFGKELADRLGDVRNKDDFQNKVLPSAVNQVKAEFLERNGSVPSKTQERAVLLKLEAINKRIFDFLNDNKRETYGIKALADPLGQNFGVHFGKLLRELDLDLSGIIKSSGLKDDSLLSRLAKRNTKGELEPEIREMKEVEALFAKTGIAPEFRKALLNAFSKHTDDDIKSICAKIGLDANIQLQLLSAVRNQTKNSGKAVADLIMDGLLEKTFRDLDNWNARVLKSSRFMYGEPVKGGEGFTSIGDYKSAAQNIWKKDQKAVNDIQKIVSGAEQFDYQALRKELKKSEGYAQYTETLMSMVRGYNRIADFVLWGNRPGGTWAGSTLGFYKDQRNFSMQSYGTKWAMYNQLVNNSRFHDDTWIDQVQNRKQNPVKLTEDYNAEAYLELQKRGLLFADYNKGMGYIHSADHRGAMVMMDYLKRDENNSGAYEYRNGKPIIDTNYLIKDTKSMKGDEYNMMPLLARIQSSPYAENQYGIILVQQDSKGKWRRRMMENDHDVHSIYSMAQATHSLREEFGQVLAESKNKSGADLKWKAISAADYIDNYMGKPRRAVEWAGSKFGHLLYGAFYDQTMKQNDWYVAQAQTRFALQTVPMIASRIMTPENTQLATEAYLGDPKKVQNVLGLFSKNRYGLSASQLEEVRIEANKIAESDFSANFARRYRQKQFRDVSGFESEAYARESELKALKKLGYLTGSKGEQMEGDMQTEIKNLRTTYKELKEQFHDFRKLMVELTGSHSGYYGSNRNIFTTWSIMPDDWRHSQGMMYDFYNVVESSTMRSTATALGGQQGFEYAYYMGYETGQGMYERPRIWSLGSLWEQQQVPWINISLTMHKFFVPFATSYYRNQAAMPSYFQKSEMQPGDSGDYRQSPAMLFGLAAGTTDFFRGRLKNIIDYSGAAGFIAAYKQAYGGEGVERTMLKSWLDARFMESSHVGGYAEIWGEQRYVDKYREFERLLDKGDSIIVNKRGTAGTDRTLTDAFSQYTHALEMGDVSAAERYGKMIEPYVPQMIDVRVEGQKRGYVGEMFLADGAKDRFMNMYLGFHTNTWKPIVPGMVDINPMTLRYLPFTQIAAPIDRAKEGENLSMMKTMEAYAFNEKTGKLEMSELMETHKNAYRDMYWRMEPALIHLIREQSHEMQMEMFNPYARIPGIKQIVERYRKRTWEPYRTEEEMRTQQERLNNLVLRKTGMTMSNVDEFGRVVGGWQYGMKLRAADWDESKIPPPGEEHHDKNRIWRIIATKWERRAWQWKYTKAMMDGTWLATLYGEERVPMSSWGKENFDVAARLYKLQKGRKG